VCKADNLPPSCAGVTKSGKLNFLEPSGLFQACNGTDLPLQDCRLVEVLTTKKLHAVDHIILCALLFDRIILIFLRTVVTPFPLATCHSEAARRLNCCVILYIPHIFRIVSCNAINLETDVTVRNDISVICHSAIYVFQPAAVSEKFFELSCSVPTWNFRIQLLLKFVN